MAAKAKSKIDLAPALHYAAGALKDQEILVGRHDLSSMKVSIAFPTGAAVERTEGSNGDGFDEYRVETKLVFAAALLFLKQANVTGSKKSWMRAIKQILADGTKPDELLPAEAIEALAEMNAEPVILQRRTPARRIGVALAVVSVEAG